MTGSLGVNVLEETGFPKIEISAFKCQNGLELVLCNTKNPLYAVYVTIPTFVKDDKGLPHTLEHLIFCGSEGYPERRYLDRLATLCQSQGTNAYTADDHTCYTFTSSSLSGLLRLLPVFLDHIFRPTLLDEVCLSEVFHRDGEGLGKGVVYCEMGGREWSEADQLDGALRKAVMASTNNGELDVYRWECGGSTKCIATLTNKEIREYHSTWYRPDNAVIVLCGGEDLKLEIENISSILEETKFANKTSDLTMTPANVPILFEESVALEFPTNDESLGSVGISWRGPASSDMYTISALHVLMRMLQDTSASPLYQHFVERSDPIASDIDYEVKPSHEVMISLVFSGVPTNSVNLVEDEPSEMVNFLDENALKKELLSFIDEWRQDETAVSERLEVAIKSLKLKIQESLEDEPHDLIASYIMPEVVRQHWPFANNNTELAYGKSITAVPGYLSKLAEEPLTFWMELLEKFILNQKGMEVRMLPSKKMSEIIKQKEEDQLKDVPITYELPKVTIIDKEIPDFDITPPKRTLCSIQQPSPLVQIVNVPESGVKRLVLALDLSLSVPSYLWPYLVLFQELIFQSDIIVTDEIIQKYNPPSEFIHPGETPYQALVEEFSTAFSTFEASVGFGNEIFSTNYLDTRFILALHGRADLSLEEMKAILLTILEATVFSPERVGEVLENLVTQLKESWRDASALLETRLVDRLKESHQNLFDQGKRKCTSPHPSPLLVDDSLGLVMQTGTLNKARDQLKDDPNGLMTILEHIRKCLLTAPMIVNFGSNALYDQDEGDKLERFLLYPLPRHGILEESIINEDAHVELIPVQDITSSYMTINVPIDILPRGAEPFTGPVDGEHIDRLLSVILLCQLMSFTEGPLYGRIRGAGLAYHASLSVAVWNGILTFYLGDSIDPVKALAIFTQLVHDTIREADAILANDNASVLEILTEETLKTGKAVQIFSFVNDRSTASAIVATSLRCALRGMPPVGSDEEASWNESLLALTLKDVAKIVKEVMPRMIDAKMAIRLATVPHSKLEEIKKDMLASGHHLIVNHMVDQSNNL